MAHSPSALITENVRCHYCTLQNKIEAHVYGLTLLSELVI